MCNDSLIRKALQEENAKKCKKSQNLSPCAFIRFLRRAVGISPCREDGRPLRLRRRLSSFRGWHCRAAQWTAGY